MFTLAQLYCKNILPPVLCNYKIFLDCVSLQSLSPLPRVSWHGAAAALGSQEPCARAGSKMAARRPPEMSPARPASPRAEGSGGRAGPQRPLRKPRRTFPTERSPATTTGFFFLRAAWKTNYKVILQGSKFKSGDRGLFWIPLASMFQWRLCPQRLLPMRETRVILWGKKVK